MSDNLNRTLVLLEHLSAAKESGVTVAQLVEQTSIASSTVYRLVQELEVLGYLHKTDNRRLFPKFQFEQGKNIGGVDVGRLTEACESICQHLGVASEFIALRRESLFWHVAKEHPQQSIRLRARVGFVRGTYELDCITRMALAHFPIEDIEKSWDITGFYQVGVTGGKVPWDQARKQFSDVDTAEPQFDLSGNSKGVRRFCVAIQGPKKEFAGLLTAAEAATPLRDVDEHVAHVCKVLLDAKVAIERDSDTKNSMLTKQA